jgi:hypothetical protein
VKAIRAKHQVPPELIEAYERGHMEGIRFEPGDFDDAEPPSSPVEEAEWILLDSDLNRDMHAEHAASVMFDLIQRKGTTVLYVVQVSEDGKKVNVTSSNGSNGWQVGRPVG